MLSWLFSDPLQPGDDAPDFTLRDQDGHPVSLAALRGKNVVLVFYPADETTLCTQQLCEFRDNWALAQSKEAVVLGINPAAETKHARFREHHHFPFPLLADPGRQVSALYRAKGLILKRTVYLIGKSGKIRFAQRGKPEPGEVLAAAE
ncbi:MAG TPA: peroxiredoxin [Bryobacteraceae bacterium]|nr:peroxiredoxin [Bryobacteraceae bacterium]